ncbi:MAG: hypothetical protein WDM92_12400, partial [Caulobacteraceae bacterium]
MAPVYRPGDRIISPQARPRRGDR